MPDVALTEFRRRPGVYVDRAAVGERIVITRAGEPIAELMPVRKQPLTAEVLVERSRHLPPVDYGQMRAELDEIIDPTL